MRRISIIVLSMLMTVVGFSSVKVNAQSLNRILPNDIEIVEEDQSIKTNQEQQEPTSMMFLSASAMSASTGLDESFLVPDLQLRRLVNARLGKSGADLDTYSATAEEMAALRGWFTVGENSQTNYLEIESLEGLQYLTGTDTIVLSRLLIQEKELAVVSQMTWLTMLRINSVTFTGGTGETTRLLNKSINGGPIQATLDVPIDQDIDLGPIGNLVNLKTLEIGITGIEEIAAYSISHRTYFHLAGLENLVNLESLSIDSFADVDDPSFSFIANLPKLKRIVIVDTYLLDVYEIAKNPNIVSLNINGTYVRDFTPVIDKAYFTGASSMKYNYLTQFYDAIDFEGTTYNAFNLDTGIALGQPIKTINFSTVSSHLGVFGILDMEYDTSLKLLFNINSLKSYQLLNYVTGDYDLKKLGFVFGTTIVTDNNKTIQYGINTITIGKKVVYDANYENGTVEEVKYEPFAPIVAPTDITRTGHNLLGWYTDRETTLPYDFNAIQHMNLDLFAKWEIASYKLSFDLNGATGTAPDQQIVLFEEKATAVADPTRTGYTFNGWNTENDGTGMNWDFENTTMPGNDVTLYAIWVPNNYEVTFNSNGGSGSMSEEPYYYEETKPLYKNLYSKEGHQFVGWSPIATDEVMYQDQDEFTYATTQEVILFAKWEAISYTMTFDAQNGLENTIPDQVIPFEGKATMPVNPVRDGYTFLGWNTVSDGTGNVWDFETMLMPANNVTLYGQWVPNEYVVTFDGNGGIGKMNQEAYYYLETKPLFQNKFVKEGYRFIGWSLTQTGDVAFQDEATLTFSSIQDMTLYAKWEAVNYNLLFDANGGTGSMTPQSYKYMEQKALNSSAFVKENAEFMGWAVTPNGPVVYTNQGMYSFEQTKDTVLYAKWKENAIVLPETGVIEIGSYVGGAIIIMGVALLLETRKQER